MHELLQQAIFTIQAEPAYPVIAGMLDGLQASEVSEPLLLILLATSVVLLTVVLIRLRRMRLKLEKETTALKHSENHLRSMGDHLPHIAVFQLIHALSSDRYAFTFLSSGFERVLGLEREEIMNDARIGLDHIYEADIDVLQQSCSTAAERLETANMDIRVLDGSGSYKWLNISAIPQRRGDTLVWDGFMQDVSSSKAVEQAMAEESRNFKMLFETIDDFLIVSDMDGNLLHSNPAIEKRLGFSHEALVNMSLFELYSQDHRAEVYRILAELQSSPASSCRLPLQAENGSTVPVEMNLFQGAWKHQKAIFGVARNIAQYQQTENALRESKKILQLIIDSIPMSIFWKDKDSVYLGCNQAFMHECQLNEIDALVGKTPYDLFDASLALKIVERDQHTIQTNKTQTGHTESHTRPDGSIGQREVTLIPLREDSGRAAGVLGIWRDITEHTRAEERLKRTLDDMERFNQLMRGRERRTLELKHEVNQLLVKLGIPKKYRTTADGMSD